MKKSALASSINFLTHMCLLVIVFATNNVKASNNSEVKTPIKTNQNKISDEFNTPLIQEMNSELETLKQIGIDSAISQDKSEIFLNEEITQMHQEKDYIMALPEVNVEGEGRSIRASKDNTYFNEFETDYTKPGAMAHKRDAEAIVKEKEDQLVGISKTLSDIGFDCKEEEKNKLIKDPFYIESAREEIKETEYDQKFCEQAQGTYKCTKTLKLQCAKPNLTYFAPDKFNSGSLPKKFDLNTKDTTFGWRRNIRDTGGAGKQFDYEISFDIESIEDIKEFVLKEIYYDDLIRITVNDKQVVARPFGGTKLELLNIKGSKQHFFQVRIDDSNNLYSAEQNVWRYETPNIDLKTLLKSGNNKINIRLIVGGGGGLFLTFATKINSCNSWIENWEEQCKL